MTDREYNKQKNRVRALMSKWQNLLLLEQWQSFSVYYERGLFSEDEDGHSSDVTGFCQVDWKYKRAAITFSMLRVAQNDDRELEYVVLHEIGHALVNQMREFKYFDGDNYGQVMPHEEHVVTNLALCFQNVYDRAFAAGVESTKKKKGKV